MTDSSTQGTLSAVELFAGGGGMAVGSHRAGFRHLALLERDPHAVETLRANAGEGQGSSPVLPLAPVDVTEFDYSSIQAPVDLLAGGAPCQPFSLAGRHRGKADSRNLFPEVFRAQRALGPKAVLLENVRGLARKGFMPYLEYILLQLALPGLPRNTSESWDTHKARLTAALTQNEHGDHPAYNVHFRVINCADFGVPQKRFRVFIVATRSDLGRGFRWPEPTHSEAALRHSQTVTGTYWHRHKLSPPEPLSTNGRGKQRSPPTGTREPWRTVRDALAGLPEPSVGEPHPCHPNHVGIGGARIYPGHTGSPLDEPSKTLKAGVHGVPGGENMIRFPDGSVRYLTVHEAALIQTFPRTYRFVGSRTEAMRQIGNAAPVVVCEAIAVAIRDFLAASSQATVQRSSAIWVDLAHDRPLALV